jgi:hypothetical protein
MHARSRKPFTAGQGLVLKLAGGLVALVFASLLTVSVAPASASTGAVTPEITVPASVSAVPSGEAEELLSGISLSDLNTAQLTEALSSLPGLSGFPSSKLNPALSKAIEGLQGKNATLGKLLEPSEVVPTLETELKKLLSVFELLSLLKGETLASKLTAALGSLTPSELVNTLVSSSASPQTLLAQAFAGLDTQKLEATLGAPLADEPFANVTVGELAGELGMTTEALTEELGTTIGNIPQEAAALTAPLTNGKRLAVLGGLSAVTLGLIEPASQEEAGGEKEESHEQKTGGEETPQKKTGGTSGGENTNGGGEGNSDGADQGSSGDNSGETPATAPPADTGAALVSLPLAQAAASQPPRQNSSKTPAKIRILSHRLRGKRLTLVLQVPAAGKIAVRGKGVRSMNKRAIKAERFTLHLTLTGVGKTSVSRHHRKQRVKLTASFRAVGGSSSSVALTVTLY